MWCLAMRTLVHRPSLYNLDGSNGFVINGIDIVTAPVIRSAAQAISTAMASMT